MHQDNYIHLYILPVVNIQSKHPRTLTYHPAVFNKLSVRLVRKHKIKTHGSAWRRLLSAFGQASTNLFKLVAKFVTKLATSIIPTDYLIAYNGSRLVALDKRSSVSVQYFCIGEILHRITGRIIVNCIRQDLISLGGNTQLCRGQKCGIEMPFNCFATVLMIPKAKQFY